MVVCEPAGAVLGFELLFWSDLALDDDRFAAPVQPGGARVCVWPENDRPVRLVLVVTPGRSDDRQHCGAFWWELGDRPRCRFDGPSTGVDDAVVDDDCTRRGDRRFDLADDTVRVCRPACAHGVLAFDE